MIGEDFLTVSYNNATECKFKNRRVAVIKDDSSKDLYIQFKILTDKESANTPSAAHDVIKDKIKITTVRLSNEAAKALYISLGLQLKKYF